MTDGDRIPPLVVAIPLIVILGGAALVCFALDDLYRLLRRLARRRRAEASP